MSVGNVCGLYYLVAGGFAAYLFVRRGQHYASATLRDGAIVGVLTGAFGAIVALAVNIVGLAFGYDPIRDALRIMLNTMSQSGIHMDPTVSEASAADILRMTGYLATFVGFVILAGIGGLVGVAIFRRKDTPSD